MMMHRVKGLPHVRTEDPEPQIKFQIVLNEEFGREKRIPDPYTRDEFVLVKGLV